jgi:hypothetical protein
MIAVEPARWDVELTDKRMQLLEGQIAGQMTPQPIVSRNLSVVNHDGHGSTTFELI